MSQIPVPGTTEIMYNALNKPAGHSFIRRGRLSIRLAKRTAKDVIEAAAPFKMDGWASSAARELDEPDLPMFAIECEGKGIVGQAGIRVRGLRATATVALFDPKYRGRGIGTLAMRVLLAYAFLTLGLERVVVRVDKANRAALRCYHRAGFVMAKDNKDGSVLMEAQRGSWPEIHDASAPKLADGIGSWVDVV